MLPVWALRVSKAFLNGQLGSLVLEHLLVATRIVYCLMFLRRRVHMLDLIFRLWSRSTVEVCCDWPYTLQGPLDLTGLIGYTLGFAEAFPGNALVYQSNGTMIYVSIQYRLGAYGFLAGAEVTENGDRNVGLLDQRAALIWTQRHIRKFGGDPSKVSIIGGSAGGGSVMNQMILYGGVASPPFRAAMAGSSSTA